MKRPRPNDDEPWTEPEGGETPEALVDTTRFEKAWPITPHYRGYECIDGTTARGHLMSSDDLRALVLPWWIAKDPSIVKVK